MSNILPNVEKKVLLSTVLCCLLCINTMNGPGLVSLSYSFRGGGIAFTTFALILMAYVTIQTGSCLIDTIAGLKIKKGAGADKAWDIIEISTVVAGRKFAMLIFILLILSLLSLELAQMILCSQVMDAIIIFMLGKSYAFDYEYLINHDILNIKTAKDYSILKESTKVALSPFGDNANCIISVGYLVCCFTCLGLATIDLSNATVQKIFFYLMCIAGGIFSFTSSKSAMNDIDVRQNMEEIWIFGNDSLKVLGIVILNFAYIAIVPTVYADADPKNVNFKKVLQYSTWFMCFFYLLVGITGCLGSIKPSINQLEIMVQPKSSVILLTGVACYIISQMGAIPIYGEIIKVSLIENNVCNSRRAHFIANIIPWIICGILYKSDTFGKLVEWASLLFLGFITYSIPLYLFIVDRIKNNQNFGKQFIESIIIFLFVTIFIIINIILKLGVPKNFTKFFLITLCIFISLVVVSKSYNNVLFSIRYNGGGSSYKPVNTNIQEIKTVNLDDSSTPVKTQVVSGGLKKSRSFIHRIMRRQGTGDVTMK